VPAAHGVVVEQPRAFGHVIGDVLAQSVLLERNGAEVTPEALPPSGRVGMWLERRGAQIEKRADGRRWLRVEYQIVNSPEKLRNIQIPAWELKVSPPGGPLLVPAASIDVGPLTLEPGARGSDASTLQGAEAALQPDRAAPLIQTARLRQWAVLWTAALAASLLAWLAWLGWRNHVAAANQPFARAARELRRLDDTSEQSWQCLHRAFDRTAGRVVQRETLPELFRRAPHFEPVRAAIEQFFSQSSERFFGSGLAATPMSVRALCGELRRLEKQYER